MRKNPFKLLPPDLTKAIRVKLKIRDASSGYIFEDQEYHFGARFCNSGGDRITIDKSTDFYVSVWLVHNDKSVEMGELLHVPSSANPSSHVVEDSDDEENSELPPLRNQLPSCLFADCKQGDQLCFVIDGKMILAEIDQQLKLPYQAVDHLSFEDRLEAVRSNIPFGSAQYKCDINPNKALSNQAQQAVRTYAEFFHPKSTLLVQEPIRLGKLGSDTFSLITQEALPSIPTPALPNVEELKTNELTNSNGTISVICNVPGMDFDKFHWEWIQTATYTHLFVHIPEGHRFSKAPSLPPEYYTLTLRQAEFQHGIEVESLKDGVLTLRSKLPKPEAELEAGSKPAGMPSAF